ncbi:uncharacterized protein BT62DRAFT_996013 [Guyanagaster necrorhizus]|uniref:Uncharacterized protein n=1 Tax=Guyanagaster necrorhizus TaxID=856835 RepID=A0A9P8APY2_9AGAR|nr:uncharacterized protein BT62DRAFT_996013 [Guyanagaster necrorhizus MCA 3950]KAG7443450.1 hypothetical protein BT62DRAFT_996013 [Guyanagaster necrorhizus MCA 3950]
MDDVLATSHDSNMTGLTADSDPVDGNASCVLAPEATQGPYYPVSDAYIDFWHCNATGAYAGVIVSGNGNSNDPTNMHKTFLRGIQVTNDDGYAQFETIFIGQFFFDENLITVVEATSPYISNTQQLTTNSNDSIIAEEVEDAPDGIDLTSTSGTTFLMVSLREYNTTFRRWGSMAIDLSSSYTTLAAGALTEDGSVMSDTSSSGGMGGSNDAALS